MHTNYPVLKVCESYRLTLLSHFFDDSPQYGVGGFMRMLEEDKEFLLFFKYVYISPCKINYKNTVNNINDAMGPENLGYVSYNKNNINGR